MVIKDAKEIECMKERKYERAEQLLVSETHAFLNKQQASCFPTSQTKG